MSNSPEHQTETDDRRQAYLQRIKQMIADGTYDESIRLPYVAERVAEEISLDTLPPIC